MNIKRKIKQLLDPQPKYRVISKTYHNHKYWMVQKKDGWHWDYMMDSTCVGFDKQKIEYPACFESFEAADVAARDLIKQDIESIVVTKIEKVYTSDESISTK